MTHTTDHSPSDKSYSELRQEKVDALKPITKAHAEEIRKMQLPSGTGSESLSREDQLHRLGIPKPARATHDSSIPVDPHKIKVVTPGVPEIPDDIDFESDDPMTHDSSDRELRKTIAALTVSSKNGVHVPLADEYLDRIMQLIKADREVAVLEGRIKESRNPLRIKELRAELEALKQKEVS